MSETSQRHVLTVLVPDRLGVVCDVTGALSRLGGNIDGFRQSIVNGFFSLTLTVSFSEPQSASNIDDAVRRGLGLGPDTPSVLVRPHAQPPVAMPGGTRYVAMVRGRDRSGLLHRIARFFLERRINMEDWQVQFDGNDVIHVGQITLCRMLDIRQLQQDFTAELEKAGLRATLCHENIFRATSDIGPIGHLTAEVDDA